MKKFGIILIYQFRNYEHKFIPIKIPTMLQI